MSNKFSYFIAQTCPLSPFGEGKLICLTTFAVFNFLYFSNRRTGPTKRPVQETAQPKAFAYKWASRALNPSFTVVRSCLNSVHSDNALVSQRRIQNLIIENFAKMSIWAVWLDSEYFSGSKLYKCTRFFFQYQRFCQLYWLPLNWMHYPVIFLDLRYVSYWI